MGNPLMHTLGDASTSELRGDRLGFQVRFEPFLAEFSAPTRLSVAVEWDIRANRTMTVDRYVSGSDTADEPMRGRQAGRPDAT